MVTVPDRSTFESAYAGQAPWDIGTPHKALLNVADRTAGSVLEAGCGTGYHLGTVIDHLCRETACGGLGIDISKDAARLASRRRRHLYESGGCRSRFGG